MKKILILGITASFLLAGSIQQRVPVNYSEPVYRTITIQTPQKECWQEEQQGQNTNAVGTIIGGAAGGVLGHQIGKGRGKTAATIGGAILGSMLGNNYINSGNQARTARTVTKCKTTYSSSTEQRLVGYRNYAKLGNKDISKTSRRELEYIIIRLSW